MMDVGINKNLDDVFSGKFLSLFCLMFLELRYEHERQSSCDI